MTETMTETFTIQATRFLLSTPTSACSHDFIAPEGKPEHAICGKCGNEPRYEDYARRRRILRYVPVREWVDIALKCVKVG
jgi:hypothetical protein